MKGQYLYSGLPGSNVKDDYFKNVKDNLGMVNLREAVLNSNDSETERQNLLEAVKKAAYSGKDRNKLSLAAQSELDAIEMLIENVSRASISTDDDGNEVLREAATDTSAATLNGVTMISFGLQRRAMVSAHLHRSMATITTKTPRVKVAEKKSWIKDIKGNRHWFVDAFRPDPSTKRSPIMDNLNSVVSMEVTLPGHNLDIHTEASLSKDETLSNDIYLKSDDAKGIGAGFDIVKADGTTPIAGGVRIKTGSRYMDPEKGHIHLEIEYGDETDEWNKTAAITLMFNMNEGALVSATSTSDKVKKVHVDIRPSNETHLRALTVGFQIDQKTVEITDSEHIEAKLVKELQDDAEAYYNLDLLQENTDLLTTSVTQIRDNKIYDFLMSVSKIDTFTFDCAIKGTYAKTKDAYMEEKFKPFLDKIAIQLKDKTQIKDCHFRVVGNPMDIRIAADNQMVYQKSQVYDGSITLDYDFSLVNGVHTFYVLSSDRVAPGKMYVQLIPNQLDNNIITTMFAQYKVMVTNNYRSSQNAALPATVMSDRAKAFDYFPVVAEIDVTNNDIE